MAKRKSRRKPPSLRSFKEQQRTRIEILEHPRHAHAETSGYYHHAQLLKRGMSVRDAIAAGIPMSTLKYWRDYHGFIRLRKERKA